MGLAYLIVNRHVGTLLNYCITLNFLCEHIFSGTTRVNCIKICHENALRMLASTVRRSRESPWNSCQKCSALPSRLVVLKRFSGAYLPEMSYSSGHIRT